MRSSTRSMTVVIATAMLVAAGPIGAAAAAPGAYDRPGRTERVSVASNGAQGDARPSPGVLYDGYRASDISRDGRYVVFTSDAHNLVSGDTNLAADVFRHDRRTRRTVRVSLSSDGAQAIAAPGDTTEGYSVSADGRFVAFHSQAINLVPGDTNRNTDVFVRDMRGGRTVRASIASDGTQANHFSHSAAISANGRYVAFWSEASNLVPGDTNNTFDVFVHDLRTRKTVRASVSSKGAQADRASMYPSLSADGRYVVFQSNSSLTPDGSGHPDVYRRDLKTGKTELVSVASDGAKASFAAFPACRISSTPLVTLPPPSPIRQIGGGGFDICGSSSMGGHAVSADGRYVTFRSNATNLVPNDTNFSVGTLGWDAFVHDMRTGRTERVSVDSYGRQRDERIPIVGSISATGRYVVTTSSVRADAEDCAEDLARGRVTCLLAGGDWTADVYDRATGTDESLAVSRGSRSPAPGPCNVLDKAVGRDRSVTSGGGITPDGRFLSIASSGQDVVAGDTNRLCDYFVRDRGLQLGTGGFGGPESGSAPGPDQTCVADGVCLPPLTASGSAGSTEVPGADLIDARVVPRPHLGDLFVRLHLEHMPTVTGTSAGGLLYGLTFTVGGERYEVRVQRVPGADFDAKGGASFGLFRENRVTGLYTKVATLKGGYGTTGPSVVFAVPVEHLAAGGRLSDVRAFTGIGSYLTGAAKPLDMLRLQR